LHSWKGGFVRTLLVVCIVSPIVLHTIPGYAAEAVSLSELTRRARTHLENATVGDTSPIVAEIESKLKGTAPTPDTLDALEVIGDLYLDAGQKDHALRSIEVAARLSETLDDRSAINAIRRLAGKLRAMGSRITARNLIEKAVERLDRSPLPGVEIAALYTELGLLEAELGEPRAAEQAYRSALEHVSERDVERRLMIRVNLLKVRSRQAIPDLSDLAFSIERELPTLPPASQTDYLLDLGDSMLRVAGDHAHLKEAARRYLLRSLEIARSENNPCQEALALGYLGHLHELDDNLSTAIRYTREAILKTYSLDDNRSLYRWQWQLGRLLLRNGDMDRAMGSYRDAVNSMLGVRSELLLGSYVQFRETVIPLFEETLGVMIRQARTAANTEIREILLADTIHILEEFNTAEVLEYFDDDCMLPASGMTLADIAPDTAVIYPIVLERELVVLVHSGSGLETYAVPVSKAELVDLVLEYRQSLEMLDDDYLAAAGQLYQWLFAPFAAELRSTGVDTIVFVPTGTLRTIPVSTLHDGRRFLIDDFSIVTSLGLKLTVADVSGVTTAKALLGGISEAVQGFSGLPGVTGELTTISERFPGKVMLNDAFSLEGVSREMTAGDHSIVHFATHGYFDPDPLKSFLLTYDDKLTLNRLQETVGTRRFTGNPLELLVLSACETAAGDERAALGLAGVSLKAGAHTTLASLWPISDAATSELMMAFYENLSQGEQKSDALRLAQLKLMNDTRFDHPFFWSPFLLIGKWL
jgi:CHAT domain-containing protein